jgi:predicted N-acetyltransferase YhbS
MDGLTGGRGATAVELRPGRRDDAEVCGRICYEAFSGIADTHGFPSDFASLQVGVDVASEMLAHPQIYAVVAEIDGRVVGCNFLDERSAIVGVGPVGVDPAVQNRGVGRALMLDVLRRATDRRAAGVRLLQSAYHSRSLSLYASLGFTARDVLACMNGTPPTGRIPGRQVRPATTGDLEACAAACRRVHGHDRTAELADAIAQGAGLVVEHDGRISGYASDLGFTGHAVGESDADVEALILAADAFPRLRDPGADHQRRAVPVVPGARPPRRAHDDADEHRSLHHTPGCLPAQRAVLTRDSPRPRRRRKWPSPGRTGTTIGPEVARGRIGVVGGCRPARRRTSLDLVQPRLGGRSPCNVA